MDITYSERKAIAKNLLLELYTNAGWTAYTTHPEKLVMAIRNSQFVLSAWHQGKLVGLIRTIGDGSTITYIQDILVHTDFKRKKIGSTLMGKTIDRFQGVRQMVLLTDDNKESRGFYESLGFESCDRGKLVSFVRFV